MFSNILRQISVGALRKGSTPLKLQAFTTSHFTATKCLTSSSPTILPWKFIPPLADVSNVKIEKSFVYDKPLPYKNTIQEIPLIADLSYLDKINWNVAVEEPTKTEEKQAARLIVIRKRKMKRHKLKKLRKKMKFEWAKVRQRRELRKEKAFQAELMGKIREAEKFDAAVYASQKINKANEVLIPKLWRGKRLPEFVIKDLIVESSKKRAKKEEKKERRKNMKWNVSDYNV